MNEKKETIVYESKGSFNKNNLFWGIFFLLAAVFLIIGKLDLFPNFSIFKLFITIMLVAWLVKSLPKKDFYGILLPVAFLGIMYDDFLGIEALTPWPLLGAAFFAAIGLSFLFERPKHLNHNYTYPRPASVSHGEEIKNGIFVFSNSFAESVKYVNSDDFIQADINNSFGSSKVYFDDAIIQQGQANINLNVKFGSLELFFPKTWNVINHASATLGSIDENNRSCTNGAPTVILNGDVAFGSVTITYI